MVTLGLVRALSLGYRAHLFDDDIVTNATRTDHEDIRHVTDCHATYITSFGMHPIGDYEPATDIVRTGHRLLLRRNQL